MPRRKIWKLHEDLMKTEFSKKEKMNSQKNATIEIYWNVLRGDLLEITGRSCG